MAKELLRPHRHVGRILVREAAVTQAVPGADGREAPASLNVTVFRCVNCSRPDTVPSSATVQRPPQPEPEWPIPVHEIALPCTGRLQPEHLLKAFEAGADAVCVITCAGDNCRYLEGSRRAERRVQYVRELLNEIGLGDERLLVFHLATSAQEDVPPGHTPKGPPGTQLDQKENGSRATEIRDMVLARLGVLQPNPLGQDKAIL